LNHIVNVLVLSPNALLILKLRKDVLPKPFVMHFRKQTFKYQFE